MPSNERLPDKNIDVPDILPLKHSETVPDRKAMLNSSPLVHPDSKNLQKYCLGTGQKI